MPVLHQVTKDTFGYEFDDLGPKSQKNVVFACDKCGKHGKRQKNRLQEINLCHNCAMSKKQSAETVAKRKATNIEKYGGPSPLSSATIRQKQKETVFEKYGVDAVSRVPAIRAKASATMQERLGVPYAMMSTEVREKSKETCLEKYGVEYNTQSDVMKEKSSVTRLAKYGVVHHSQAVSVKIKAAKTKIENYGTSSSAGTFGAAEKEVATLIASWGIEVQSTQHVLNNGKTIDILLPGNNIGIEYCGLYWHNELSPEPRDHGYHNDKMKIAAAEGIRLITLFEDEWLLRRAQVENFLKSALGVHTSKLGARDCEVREITVSEANEFLEHQHVQGAGVQPLFAVGIFKEELLGVMTLGRHHRQGQDVIVLSRLAFKTGVSIAGGAARLLKPATEYARVSGYEKMVSWSDNRLFTGTVYGKMGFVLAEELNPDYTYVVRRRPVKRLSKQSQKKSSTDCPEGLTEHEWAKQRGLARVWDCGHKRWELVL